MLSVHYGVSFRGMTAQAGVAIQVVHERLRSYRRPCHVTEVFSPGHTKDDGHSMGRAVCFRPPDISAAACVRLVGELRQMLGADYRVYMARIGTRRESVHVEYIGGLSAGL